MQTKVMPQTRVVIPGRLRPIAEELQSLTGVSSLSDVVAMLLTKYAQHLKSSWIESGVNGSTVAQPVEFTEPIREPQFQIKQSFTQLEPDPEPEPEIIDPVIERIAKLADRF